MAEPNKETVLKWYRDLQTQLKAEGIDVNKPEDLIRIKSYYFYQTDNKLYPGILKEQKGEKKFAFMPRKKGAQGLMVDYLNPEPPKPTEQQQAELANVYLDQKNAKAEASSYLKELETAYKKDKPDDIIIDLKNKIPKADKRADDEFQRYNKKLHECFDPYNAWAISNQKLFDEEEDYEQILDLYNQASQGLLYFDAVNGEPRDFKQILVTETGEACFTNSSLDEGYSNTFPDAIFADKTNTPEKVAEFERKYGEIEVPKTLNEMYPDEPDNVAKPGAWSWFKRIITFGINKSDFVRYDRHQERLQTLAEHNKQCYDTMFHNLDQEVKNELPKNILNPGKVTANRYFVTVDDFTPDTEADPERGIYNTTLQICEMNNLTYLQIEAHENPASFNNDGIRQENLSNLYWAGKGQILNPENIEKTEKVKRNIAQEQPKHQQRMADKEIKKSYNRILNDKKYQETLLEEGKVMIGKRFPKASDKSVWVKEGFENIMTKIGKLYGGGAPEGMKIVSVILTQNQALDREGRPSTQERVPNTRIAEIINAMIKISDTPNIAQQEPLKQYYDIGAQALKTPYHEFRMMESAASLFKENIQTDAYDIETVNAVCAMLVSKRNEQMSRGYSYKPRQGEEDLRIANDSDIKEICKMGNFLRIAQKGMIELPDAKQKAAPEFETKRPLNLGI